MKSSRLAMSLALASGLMCSAAIAADSGLRQPASPTAFESYDAYYSTANAANEPMKAPAPPSEKVAPDAAPAAAAATGEGCGCNNSCNSCCDCNCGHHGCFSGCKLDCPEACPEWKLFDDCCCLKEHKITMGGWIEAGYTFNAENPADHFNGPNLFNDRDEFMMNQLMVFADRATDTQGCGWDLGGHIEFLYGTDARFIKSLGLELDNQGNDRWNSQRFYQVAMPQAYVEVAYDYWKIKVGKYVTPLEYEVINATGNFFYSHTYGFGYAVPFTHTGVYATHDAGDQVSFGLGVNRGWDRWEDDNDKASFVGHMTWKSCDKKDTVVFALSSGDELAVANLQASNGNRTAYTLSWSEAVNDRLTLVLAHDLGVQENGFGPNVDSQWYGIEQYLLYQLSCDWWLGARFEWFRDEDGTRVTQTTSGNSAAGPFPGSFFDFTLGLNYKPLCNPNLIVRPEVRYDWFNREGAGPEPYDDGTSDHQFTAAFDVIYKF